LFFIAVIDQHKKLLKVTKGRTLVYKLHKN